MSNPHIESNRLKYLTAKDGLQAFLWDHKNLEQYYGDINAFNAVSLFKGVRLVHKYLGYCVLG